MITADELAKLQLTALQGLPIDLSGVPLTEETTSIFMQLEKEINEAPKNVMVEIPNEWASPEKYSTLIDATYSAHGKPRTYAEMNAAQEDGETPLTFG